MLKLRFVLFTVFFISNCFSAQIIDNSFITKKEYGAMLYKNPRGIGCHKCHGETGQGMLIAKYKHKDKKTNKVIEKSIFAPAINHLSFQAFEEILIKKRNRSLTMPTYFLTEDELTSIHFYISSVEK